MRPGDDRSPLMRYLAPTLVALLAIVTVGAFAHAQRLKREPLVLDKVSFGTRQTRGALTPNGDCVNDRGRIRFRITRSDRADVEITDPDGRRVRTLASDRFLKRYRFFVFHWDGRTGDGTLADPGRYKLRLVLREQDRTITPGGSLRVHRASRVRNGCRGRVRPPPDHAGGA